MIKGVDNVGVAVSDLARAVAFYARLGFEVADASEAGTTVQAGTAVLYLFPASGGAQAVRRSLAFDDNPVGIDHVSFRVEDTDAAFAELGRRGVEVESGPEDQEWGSRTISVLDPDGNRLWFLGPLGG